MYLKLVCTVALRAVPSQYARYSGNLRLPTSADFRNQRGSDQATQASRFIQAQCNFALFLLSNELDTWTGNPVQDVLFGGTSSAYSKA